MHINELPADTPLIIIVQGEGFLHNIPCPARSARIVAEVLCDWADNTLHAQAMGVQTEHGEPVEGLPWFHKMRVDFE